MSTTPDDHSMLGPDPVKTAQALQGALEGMTAQLAEVKAAVRRSRRVIIALAVSLVLDVALTIGVSVAAVKANDASAQASATVTQLHSTQVSACRAGNVTREQEVMLWDHLAAISKPPAHATAAQKAKDLKQINVLLAYIRRVFAKRDCAKVYATSGPGR